MTRAEPPEGARDLVSRLSEEAYRAYRALVWEERRRPRDLVLGAVLIGLAAGNHLLTLFVAPFVALFVLWVGRAEIAARPRMLGAAVAAGLLALGVYLYIPIAAAHDPPLPYNHPVTLDAVPYRVELLVTTETDGTPLVIEMSQPTTTGEVTLSGGMGGEGHDPPPPRVVDLGRIVGMDPDPDVQPRHALHQVDGALDEVVPDLVELRRACEKYGLPWGPPDADRPAPPPPEL